jgi:hypothetical protein
METQGPRPSGGSAGRPLELDCRACNRHRHDPPLQPVEAAAGESVDPLRRDRARGRPVPAEHRVDPGARE